MGRGEGLCSAFLLFRFLFFFFFFLKNIYSFLCTQLPVWLQGSECMILLYWVGVCIIKRRKKGMMSPSSVYLPAFFVHAYRNEERGSSPSEGYVTTGQGMLSHDGRILWGMRMIEGGRGSNGSVGI